MPRPVRELNAVSTERKGAEKKRKKKKDKDEGTMGWAIRANVSEEKRSEFKIQGLGLDREGKRRGRSRGQKTGSSDDEPSALDRVP